MLSSSKKKFQICRCCMIHFQTAHDKKCPGGGASTPCPSHLLEPMEGTQQLHVRTMLLHASPAYLSHSGGG